MPNGGRPRMLNHSLLCNRAASASPVVHFGQSVSLIALTFGNDTIVECDRSLSMLQFSNLKRIGRLTSNIQALAIAFGSKEHMVLILRVHGLCEDRIEFNNSSTLA